MPEAPDKATQSPNPVNKDRRKVGRRTWGSRAESWRAYRDWCAPVPTHIWVLVLAAKSPKLCMWAFQRTGSEGGEPQKRAAQGSAAKGVARPQASTARDVPAVGIARPRAGCRRTSHSSGQSQSVTETNVGKRTLSGAKSNNEHCSLLTDAFVLAAGTEVHSKKGYCADKNVCEQMFT